LCKFNIGTSSTPNHAKAFELLDIMF